jgi:hypothetical protein
MSTPDPSGAHDNTYAYLPEPIWRDDDQAWKERIREANRLAGGAPRPRRPISPATRAIAVAVFYVAADFNTAYRAPLEEQIEAWAECFASPECDWLRVDLAMRAVVAHFLKSARSETFHGGRLLPGDVLASARWLRARQEGASDGGQ